jgi:hypothetical protein
LRWWAHAFERCAKGGGRDQIHRTKPLGLGFGKRMAGELIF